MTSIRRVITGHAPDGRAVVTNDGPAPTSRLGAQIWATTTLPANNQASSDGGLQDVGLSQEQGSVFRVMDLEPGHMSPVHRSQSLDYGLVLQGTVELLLDDDQVIVLHAGDVIVQRGTIHAWHNRSDACCRIAFILLGAKPVVIDGAELSPILAGLPSEEPRNDR